MGRLIRIWNQIQLFKVTVVRNRSDSLIILVKHGVGRA